MFSTVLIIGCSLFAVFSVVTLWCCLSVAKLSDESDEKYYREYMKRKKEESETPNWSNAPEKVANVEIGD